MLMTMVLLGRHEFSPFNAGSIPAPRQDKKTTEGTSLGDDVSLASFGSLNKKRIKPEPNQGRLGAQPAFAGKKIGILCQYFGDFELNISRDWKRAMPRKLKSRKICPQISKR